LLASSTILLAIVLSPYVFGRIERSGVSRVGLASILILGLLLPVTVRGLRAPITGAFGAVLVRTSAIIVIAVTGIPGAVMLQGFAPYRPMPGVTVDGASIGLPQLGTGPAWQAESLQSRQEVVAAVADGDVVVDLANRQAWYFFAGVAQPTTVGAYWNMTSRNEQQAVVADLERNRPALVFPDVVNPVEPGLWEPMMRPYRVTRWLWENGYRAYDFLGQTVLLSPEAAARADERFRPLAAQEADDRLVGSYPRLGEMFQTWGSNWLNLQARFAPVPTRFSAADGLVTVSDPGARPDWLLLDLQCDAAPQQAASVTWPLGDGSEHVRAIPLQSGRSLIPLGAYPSWHDASGVGSLRVAAPEGCTVAGEPQLLRLEQ
jgi:hypothetical protein